MTLISSVDDSIYQERLSSPQTANLLRVLFHSPDWAESVVRLAGVQMTALTLPARDREIVILQTAYMLKSPYVAAQHEGIADALGVSAVQREALRSLSETVGPADNGHVSEQESAWELFSARETALIRFVATLAQRTFPNTDALDTAERFFSEAELVEIVGVQGFAATIASITLTFQIDVDPVSGKDLMRFSNEVSGC